MRISGGRREVPDLSVYLVIGPESTAGRPVEEVVAAAVDGGITAVQFRWKDAPTHSFVDQARRIQRILRPRGIPFIVNDRVEVAIAVGADGIHVGQEDMDAANVRRLVGRHMLVGLSVTSANDAHALDPAVVDYAGTGPVFPTPSKADATPPLGLEGLAECCRLVDVPTVAIGGITLANASDVFATGAAGVAVISAICSASSPERAAAELCAISRIALGSRVAHL